MIANIIWRPHLDTLAGSLVIAALMFGLYVFWCRYRTRYTAARSSVLMAPKVLFALLLLFALLDPCWRVNKSTEDTVKVGILSDVSSSMDIKDEPGGSRSERAERIVAKFEDTLGDAVEVMNYQFDTDIHDPEATLPADTRNTDLGRTLVAVSEQPDLSACKAAVLVTDGGDQVVASRRIRGVPIYIVGIGTDPETWNDLSIINAETPAEVEINTPFKVAAEIQANSATNDFSPGTDGVEVRVQKLVGEEFQTVKTETVRWDEEASDQAQGDVRKVEFELPAEETEGVQEYRFSVAGVDGELSPLNNQRSFRVDVRKKNIPVLLYGRTLDWNLVLLRKKLDRDPTISLTAVYRKNADVFRIEGFRQDGDDVFARGFPTDAEVLKPYKCVVLGSFRAEFMRDACFEALRKYVEDGGSVVFLGGRESFGQGGYHRTPAAPLIPWEISAAELEIRAGEYPVMVPPEGADHGMTSATAAILENVGSPMFYSLNHVPSLRGGALGLVNASVGRQIMSVVALQPYGKGQTLGVATDTLWRWSRMKGDIGDAYHQFWRDAIRYLAGEYEGGRFLSVKWDRKRYLASEQAIADIRVIGRYAEGEVHVKGTVRNVDQPAADQTEELTVIPGENNTFRTKIFFPRSGEYAITLEATLKGEPLGTYEHTICVGSELNEGAELAVNHRFLEDLAAGSGGYYKPEQEADKLIVRLQAMIEQSADAHDIPLLNNPAIGGILPVFVILAMFILLAEWIIRRRLKMV